MDLSRIDDEFGKALRIAREAKGVTQEELAEAVERMGIRLSQATIGKIERGDRKVTVGESHALARALRIHEGELARGVSATTALVLRDRLDALRAEAKDALHAFESAQALVEVQSKSLPDTEQVALQDAVAETLEELIEDYRRDRQVDNEALLRRHELDGDPLLGARRDNRRGLRHPRAVAMILDLPEGRRG